MIVVVCVWCNGVVPFDPDAGYLCRACGRLAPTLDDAVASVDDCDTPFIVGE